MRSSLSRDTVFRLRERFPAYTRILKVVQDFRCACGATGSRNQLDWRTLRVVAPKR